MRYLLLLLLSISAQATTVYLRYGAPGSFSTITGCTNATPIVCTTSAAHGFSNGDHVWIQGVYGNWNANGHRKVASVTATTFALTDTSDVNVAGNGAYMHNGIVGKMQQYTFKDHPRMLLDGPGGTWTTKFSSPSIKAVTGWAPWDALVLANEARKAGGSLYNRPDNAMNLAFGYFMDNSRTDWRDAAVTMVNELEKFVANGTSSRSWYPGPFTASILGRGSDTDWASFYTWGYMAAYSILRDQFTAGQKAALADKMLNDRDDYGATCNQSMTLQSGTVTTTLNSTAVTGTGTDFTTITPGSIVFLLYVTTSPYSVKTHWTTVASVTNATSMTLVNAAPYSEGNAMLYVIRPWQTGDCGWRWYVRGHSFAPAPGMERRRMTFTLSAPITASDTTMTVSAAPAKAYPYYIRADQTGQVEYMLVTGAVGNTLTVTRGQVNSVAAAWPTGRIFYVADPAENFGFGSTLAGANAPEGAPYDDPRHNLTVTKIFGNLVTGLALAQDDERARLMFQANFNYYYDYIYPFNKRTWTGPTQAANDAGYNSRHHWSTLFAFLFQNNFTPAIDITDGNWLKNTITHLPKMQLPGTALQVWPFSDVSSSDFAWRHTGGAMLATAMFPTSNQAKEFMWWFKTKNAALNTTNLTRSDAGSLLNTTLFLPGPNETPIEEVDFTQGVPDAVFNTVDLNDSRATPMSIWHSRSDWTNNATSLFAVSNKIAVDHTGSYQGPGSYRLRKGSVFLFGDAGLRANDSGSRLNSNFLYVGTGSDFNGPGGPEIDRHKAAAGYSYIRINTSTAYTTNRNVTRAHRHLLHVKGSADVVIAYDHVVTSSAQVRKKTFHTFSDGNEVPTWSRTGCKAIHTRPTSNARLVVQMVGSGVTCSEVLPAITGGRTHNKLVGDFAATTSAGLFTVSKAYLNTSGDVTDISGIGTISSSHEGVEIPSLATVAAMPTNGNAVATSLTYVASAAADHYVGGMSAGTYDVTLDAAPIASNVTVDTDGLLLFTAAGGGTIAIARTDVPPPLEVVTASVPNPKVGDAYSYTLAAAGGTAPYTWSATGVPAGLSLSSAGVLSGTPTTEGQSTMVPTVTDALTDTANRNITVTVDPADPPPPSQLTIETTTLPPGIKNRAYSFTLTADGGTPPYTWSLTSTTCTGLTLSTATLTWDSAILGQCSVSVTLTDAAMATDTASFLLTIQDEQSLPNSPEVTVRAIGTLLEVRYRKAGLTNSTQCVLSTQNVSYTDQGGLASRVAYLTVPESITNTLRVDCAGAYTDTSIATATALAGTASYSVLVGASPYSHAALDYSTDGTSWTSGTPASCESGCTLTATDLTRGVAYWVRVRRRDASSDRVIGRARQITVR